MLSVGHRAIFLHAEPCERCKEVDIVCNRLGSGASWSCPSR
jgi:hypothetical protein